jgi:hypothetical protein
MPAHLPPHNDNHNISFFHEQALILTGRDKETVYKLLIEASRVWDEQRRVTQGTIPDPISRHRKYLVGYSFYHLERFLGKAEAEAVLPRW